MICQVHANCTKEGENELEEQETSYGTHFGGVRITLGFSDDETSHDEEQHMTDTIDASTRKDCDGRAL